MMGKNFIMIVILAALASIALRLFIANAGATAAKVGLSG